MNEICINYFLSETGENVCLMFFIHLAKPLLPANWGPFQYFLAYCNPFLCTPIGMFLIRNRFLWRKKQTKNEACIPLALPFVTHRSVFLTAEKGKWESKYRRITLHPYCTSAVISFSVRNFWIRVTNSINSC